MVTALYRRYRPENFAEMIGQSQVTDPLMTALRTNRVNHAYLFSGPRGCGKTTSARILARCLNCAEGPTDTPCGVCPSCVELSRDGMGSLDVVEIDAASHGGVDDARDLRERAIFAPARDRFKIFIIDEAHMVTSGGFNALLKIVEEPPEHIKFIFATTEPDKVIGTIRSRTHHYPFRLIPPAQLLEYVQQLCDTEGVEVAPGVLPLVVRAGGGSARDTLSLLDQLIAGSENNRVEYERAVALLGYTHGALLSEAIDALGTHDGAAAFDAVDRVIQTGQDPRRFVEDLLERLRDIIVVEATREQASSVLRGVPADEIEVMRRQAGLFGHAELSRVADIVNTALTEMTGATSPRLHLELMVARALVPASDDTQRGALARVERLERRIGVDGPDAGAPALAVGSAASRPVDRAPAAAPSVLPPAPAPTPVPAASSMSDTPPRSAAAEPVSAEPVAAAPSRPTAVSGPNAAASAPVSTPTPAPGAAAPGSVEKAAGAVSLQQLKDAWPEILEVVQKAKMTAWLVVFTAHVRALDGDVLTLAFPSENDVASFKERSAPGEGVSEYLRQAIVDVLGLRVKYIARVDGSLRPHEPAASAAPPVAEPVVSAPPAGDLSVPDGADGSDDDEPDDDEPDDLDEEPPAEEDLPPEPRAVVDPSGWAVPGLTENTPASDAPVVPGEAAADESPEVVRMRDQLASLTKNAPTAPRQAAPPAPQTASPAPRAATNGRPPQAPPAAPTTSWDVVAIPTSSDDVEPPAYDEPMPSDEPDLPPSLADILPSEGPASPTPPRVETAVPGQPHPARAPGAPDPAVRPGALRFEASGPETPGPAASPEAPTAPAAASAPAPTSVGGRLRYGEAVVREILGANFIEEQPLPGRDG